MQQGKWDMLLKVLLCYDDEFNEDNEYKWYNWIRTDQRRQQEGNSRTVCKHKLIASSY